MSPVPGTKSDTGAGELRFDHLADALCASCAHHEATVHGLRFVEAPARRREETSRQGSPTLVSWREIIQRAVQRATALEDLVAPELSQARVATTSWRGPELPPRVALVFGTGPLFFEALFACWIKGWVPAPLYPPQRFAARDVYAERTAALIAACGARLVLYEERYQAACEGAVERLAPAGKQTAMSCLHEPMTSVVASSGADFSSSLTAQRSGQDLALVQFSSGTTALPKPIALSHRALLSQGRLLSACWPDEPGVRQSGVSWLPLYHDMGLIGCVLPSLLRVADLTLLRPETFVARPSLWLRTLSETRATISPAPNFAFEHCLRKVRENEVEGLDLSAWRTALNGSEPISATTMQAFWKRFRVLGLRREALTPAYGLAEAGLAVTMAPLRQAPRSLLLDREQLSAGRALPKRGREVGHEEFDHAAPAVDEIEVVSLGAPLPGFELKVVALEPPAQRAQEEPAPLPHLADGSCTPVGRLWIRGPSMLSGTLCAMDSGAREPSAQNPAQDPGAPCPSTGASGDFALAPALREGWFDTGDIGFVWRHELYLVGRASDLVIVRGRNVPAPWLEQLACEASCVEAAVAIDGPATGTWVQSEAGHDASSAARSAVFFFIEARVAEGERAALGTAVREILVRSAGMTPRHLVLVRPGVLPRTSSGKLRRRAAVAAWRRGELRGALEL